jgi:tetratricopeptide (TPR) repeat protein
MGRLEEALAGYARVLEMQPFNPRAHYFLGRCLEDLGRVEDALAAFERALEIDPEHEGAAEARERLLSERGED